MGAALTLHNSIIRKLIKTYGAYEVKTIGDSFMIAAGPRSRDIVGYQKKNTLASNLLCLCSCSLTLTWGCSDAKEVGGCGLISH